MSSPDLGIEWSTTGQTPLFDTDPFYDPAVDPAQPWNLTPGLSEDLATDDDLYAWDLPGRSSGGLSGWGIAS